MLLLLMVELSLVLNLASYGVSYYVDLILVPSLAFTSLSTDANPYYLNMLIITPLQCHKVNVYC